MDVASCYFNKKVFVLQKCLRSEILLSEAVMADEVAIRCMRHCSNDYNVFYANFPEFCPICRGKIKGSFLVLPPFCVPYPFVSTSQAPFAIVVKPTVGCFLKTYKSGHDLHIGLTLSEGLVYSYDESGVHVDNSLTWPTCIAVDIFDILKGSFTSVALKRCQALWEKTLYEHCSKSEWAVDKYDPTLHNCYDFVLTFLRDILPECPEFVDKETFCNTHILPRTTKAAQYIDLYRNVVDNGLFSLPPESYKTSGNLINSEQEVARVKTDAFVQEKKCSKLPIFGQTRKKHYFCQQNAQTNK